MASISIQDGPRHDDSAPLSLLLSPRCRPLRCQTGRGLTRVREVLDFLPDGGGRRSLSYEPSSGAVREAEAIVDRVLAALGSLQAAPVRANNGGGIEVMRVSEYEDAGGTGRRPRRQLWMLALEAARRSSSGCARLRPRWVLRGSCEC